MNAITKGKLRPELISDPEQVRAWCLLMLGRESRPGEVLELRHVRDQLWEIREAAVTTKSSEPHKQDT